MASVGEEKGWTFDAFDSGTLRELQYSKYILERTSTLLATCSRTDIDVCSRFCRLKKVLLLFRVGGQEGERKLRGIPAAVHGAVDWHSSCTR